MSALKQSVNSFTRSEPWGRGVALRLCQTPNPRLTPWAKFLSPLRGWATAPSALGNRRNKITRVTSEWRRNSSECGVPEKL